MNVELTPMERAVACGVARLRDDEAHRMGLADRYSAAFTVIDAERSLTLHEVGALGEMAVAKYLGRYWSMGVNTFHAVPDVMLNIEVRTRSEPWHDLIVRPEDPQDRYYVLACVGADVDVVGYVPWQIAVDPRFRANPAGRGEAYFVPRQALYPISDLRAPTHLGFQRAHALSVGA